MTKKAYQVQITLKGSKPRIWRRLLIPSNLLLSDFHKVIQTAMGWTNSHLHQFVKDNTYYMSKVIEDDFWDEMNNVDYSKMTISDLLKNEKDRIIYEYDFGDSWEHVVELEKIEKIRAGDNIPIYLAGKNHCPPEDCGGIWGYAGLLEILKQPDHEKYDDYMEWLGGEFDPKYFNMKEVNEMLKTEDFGCIELF